MSGKLVRGRWVEDGKREALTAAGWTSGSADDFLGQQQAHPKKKPIAQVKSWSDKIAPLVDKAVNSGDFIHEVHCDDRRFVSLLTVDVCGDNTLVYMKRTDTEKLIKKLQLALAGLPQRRKTKTTKRRKRT